MKTFPKLYKKTSSGGIQTWLVCVEGNGYWTRFGLEDGKIQRSKPVVCQGKSIGRSNGTTPEEQALIEAEALWTSKQKREGYVLTRGAAFAGEESDLIQGGKWPLLAQHYKDNIKNVRWPCFAQRKYNGHRCIAIVDDFGKCTLWSRKRNPILSVPHIVKALEALNLKGVMFDGELFDFDYVREHGLEGFNKIVRKSYPIKGHEVVKYHIYDAPLDNVAQWLRFEYLDVHIGNNPKLPLVRAETRVVENIEQAMEFLEQAIDEGQEGIMLRDIKGLYLGHPTRHVKVLLKLKGRDGKCDDAEFEVVGVKEGVGNMAGKAIFQCVTEAGKKFDVKMKGTGTSSQLRRYWKHPELVIGKRITVEFNGWTKKQIPWFPRALQIREDL